MTCVLATSRKWNEVLAKTLLEKTGETFHLITRNEGLTLERLQSLKPRYVFFPHWSHIIPKEIYEKFECVVFHMTDLPYGRGGSPLQNLILQGHKKTLISALLCVEELDCGPIYLKRPLTLEGAASEIFARAAKVMELMIEDIVRAEPVPKPQQGEPVVFRRRTPSQSNLCEAKISNLNDLYNFIRMLDAEGYPKAFVDSHEHRIEFSGVKKEQGRLVGSFNIRQINSEKS